jgi:hypothetical protein
VALQPLIDAQSRQYLEQVVEFVAKLQHLPQFAVLKLILDVAGQRRLTPSLSNLTTAAAAAAAVSAGVVA